MENKKRRSSIKIMLSLINLIKPLLHVMFLAILLGVLGFLCAIFITIIGSRFLFSELSKNIPSLSDFVLKSPLYIGVIILISLAILRGVFHYIEQYCNHFTAFKLLAILRNKIFTKLRTLCPAKLEGKDRGNLISIITTDIELLEVFYAHTISPIAIAFITSLIMLLFIGSYSIYAALVALLGYLFVGVVIPLFNGKRGGDKGMDFRNSFGELNSFVLDSLRGLDETIQYQQGEIRKQEIDEHSKSLTGLQKTLSDFEGTQRGLTNVTIMLFSFIMLFVTTLLNQKGLLSTEAVVICTVSMMGSFGPVVALSNLSNNLNQTLASGERVLTLLEETPQVEDVFDKEEIEFQGIEAKNVDFYYNKEKILDNYSIKIDQNKIVGIYGSSGSGKSTLLKLFMRFWDIQKGKILISDRDVKEVNTDNLRSMQAYMTQETYLFNDTIANNIAISKPDATLEEIIIAAKKASIHEFIMTLKDGYNTNVGELGDILSGGEKQRIGIARMFLSNSDLYIMDEPTSNLDSLNEGIILKSIKEEAKNKTVILVSHRKSTLGISDDIVEMKSNRNS